MGTRDAKVIKVTPFIAAMQARSCPKHVGTVLMAIDCAGRCENCFRRVVEAAIKVDRQQPRLLQAARDLLTAEKSLDKISYTGPEGSAKAWSSGWKNLKKEVGKYE